MVIDPVSWGGGLTFCSLFLSAVERVVVSLETQEIQDEELRRKDNHPGKDKTRGYRQRNGMIRGENSSR